ncbi:MAG: hypothetical protein AAGC44_14645 [Planctomycetota bacterium]
MTQPPPPRPRTDAESTKSAKRLVETRTLMRPMLLLTLLALAGCNLVAATTYLIAPRPLTKAAYPLPDKKTVIFVEDASDGGNDPTLMRNVAANIEKWLVQEQALTPGMTVSHSDLETYLATLGQRRENIPLGDIARYFAADQLIYVKVTGYQMAVGGGVYRPELTAQVKVIDMEQRARVMPPELDPQTGIPSNFEYVPVSSRLPAINRTAEGSNARAVASQQLAARAGEDIAKLFFDWRQEEPGQDLGRK